MHERRCSASWLQGFQRQRSALPSRREPPEEDEAVHVQARFGIYVLHLGIIFFLSDWMQIWRVILVVAIFDLI
jgi:hypothetical protein